MSQNVFKKYFRVIVKPFALLLVFFLLLAVMSVIYWPYVNHSVVSANLPAEIRQRELERLSDPLFLVRSLSTGNFGYSSMALSLVSEELAWRLPSTLLLVGLSIITTAAVGFVLGLLFKPRRQKPQVYAHSQRNFLFGSAVTVAILLIWIFVYQVYITFGASWFPIRGLYSVPVPTDPAARTVDMLRHLALPVATLTLVGTIRTLLILWSSGTPFADKSLLKRSVFPITTIDFALFISAAIVVEYFFTLPGLGNMLISGFWSSDYNIVLGAFTVLLALGIGLGALSTVLDFIQIFFGLRQNLEHGSSPEPSPEPKTVEQPRKSTFTLFKALWKRKSLIIGGTLLIFLVLSTLLAAIAAPYDPYARMAENYAVPSWMTVFPQYSDYPGTTEVQPYWAATEGSDFVAGGRSVEGRINTVGNAESQGLNLSSSFNYPHSVAPKSFSASFKWAVQNIENAAWTARLLLVNPNGTSYLLWNEPYTSSPLNLTVEISSMDSWVLTRLGYIPTLNLAHTIFANPTKGRYNLVFYVSFRADNPLKPIRAEVSLQNFTFRIDGLVYGILGTDYIGNDMFSQVAYATGTDLAIALLVSLVAVAIGFGIGLAAGYFQGWSDNLLMVFPDVVEAIPVLPLVLVFVVVMGRNVSYIVMPFLWFLVPFAISSSRNVYVRRPKGQKLKRTGPGGVFVSIAKEFGTNLCLTAASVVLLWGAISFLGFGDPRIPSLGEVLNHSYGFGAFENLAWWVFLPPMLCMALLWLALLLIAHGLDDE